MLIVTIHNDGTGDEEIGNYNCEVLITVTKDRLLKIANARVENFKRKKGWRALVKIVLADAVDILPEQIAGKQTRRKNSKSPN